MRRALSRLGVAYEGGRDGRFHFYVEIKLRLIGLLARYQGWLAPRVGRDIAGPHAAAETVAPAANLRKWGAFLRIPSALG